MESPALVELMGMSVDEWRAFAKGSPIKRTKRRGFLRNVAIALGNVSDQDAVPVLIDALEDEEPLVRGHAAWALGRLGTSEALDALAEREVVEEDEFVLEEVRSALAR
jgi:epoxyqueuosine reductase